MARYGASLRRTTNLTVLSEDEITARAVYILAYLSSKKIVLNPSSTLLMDETVVFFKTRGATLGHHRHSSCRVALTVRATEKKLPLLLIWKDKKESIQKRGAVYVAH